jgi:hypothetical protein
LPGRLSSTCAAELRTANSEKFAGDTGATLREQYLAEAIRLTRTKLEPPVEYLLST